MKKILTILVLMIIISCNNQNNKKDDCIQTLSNALETKLPRNCILVDYKTIGSLGGDYTLTFGLKYPPLEFDSLLISLDTNNIHLSNDGRLYVYEPVNCNNCTYISVTISKIDRTIYYGCVEE
jgi:hypothetical protein